MLGPICTGVSCRFEDPDLPSLYFRVGVRFMLTHGPGIRIEDISDEDE